MNTITETPNKSRAATNRVSNLDMVSDKQILLDASDVLNLMVEYMGRWSYQVRAISMLANSEANDTDYPLFPHTIEGMADMLIESMNSSTIVSSSSDLIAKLSALAEKVSGLPAGS